MVVLVASSAVLLASCNDSSKAPRPTDNAEQVAPQPIERSEQPDFQRYFDEMHSHGTFVLYSPAENRMECYNSARADSAYTPASTFKIFNSLVALETGAVRSEHDTIAWDGVARWREEWNKSQDMSEAFKNSTVWFYQELARRAGRQRMQHYIDTVGYGNRTIGEKIDMFWLDESMKITALQQIDLLVRLHNNQLPFSQRTMDIVKDIMINDKAGNATLRAKTGTAASDICWWVGYVEKGTEVWYFAINLDIKKDEKIEDTITRRKAIVRRILADRGIFPL